MSYNWEKYTALIAEDDPMSYKYMELVLKKRTNINILWADDGKKAVEMCKKNGDIDIVLMDLQLPHLDGISSTKMIKSFKPFLPVIVQTANCWNDEKEICLSSGCDDYFTKPLNLDKLMQRIDACLKKYSAKKREKVDS